MRFQGEVNVPASREAVFDKINDPIFFASCIEGVRDMTEIDPQHFTATLETRIAYIKFKFAMTVEIVDRERPVRVVARAEGTPHGIVGRLSSTSTATLSEDGSGTKVAYLPWYDTDIQTGDFAAMNSFLDRFGLLNRALTFEDVVF
jgi:carbon monoxide dehydrogenase subunit G